MMARDIFAIQAAGVGVEREFSIAGNFNVDNRVYGDEVLGALMICNHAQSEENRASKFDYYSIQARATPVKDDELEGELDDHDNLLDSLIQSLSSAGDISDGEDEEYRSFNHIDERANDDNITPMPRGRRSNIIDQMELDIASSPPRMQAFQSRTRSRTPITTLLSSPMGRMTTAPRFNGRGMTDVRDGSVTDSDRTPTVQPVSRSSSLRGGGRRSGLRQSVRISINEAASLVNGRPATKRLRANTNGSP
jgi:hypothetical protein